MHLSLRPIAGLFFIICFFSCSKKNETPEKTITITVLEYKTKIPIHTAVVELYQLCATCTPYPGYNIVFSSKTDGDGHCEIPEKMFNNAAYGLLITPTSTATPGLQYWGQGSPGVHSTDRTYYLPLVGEEKFHLAKTSDFPGAYYIEFYEEGENFSFVKNDLARVYGFPSDTSFSIISYRGQTCKFTWNVFDAADKIISSGGPVTMDIPRTDIHQVDINY